MVNLLTQLDGAGIVRLLRTFNSDVDKQFQTARANCIGEGWQQWQTQTRLLGNAPSIYQRKRADAHADNG